MSDGLAAVPSGLAAPLRRHLDVPALLLGLVIAVAGTWARAAIGGQPGDASDASVLRDVVTAALSLAWLGAVPGRVARRADWRAAALVTAGATSVLDVLGRATVTLLTRGHIVWGGVAVVTPFLVLVYVAAACFMTWLCVQLGPGSRAMPR